MSDHTPGFTGLVDLAAASLGGRAIGTSDDFFAPMSNLVAPGRGVFVEGKFTDHGKWMDGWESRRKRDLGPGAHDWCVLELGAPGRVLGLDIDTNHFAGNCPQFASVDGLRAPPGTPVADLVAMPWQELLAPAPLRPTAQNLFAVVAAPTVSHLRLNIFPDGGVARLRAFGHIDADWSRPALDEETAAHVTSDLVDLAAVRNGGLALVCSDAFFGPMNNLLLPGRAENMGGGWETRRKRGPGHDWIVLRLGARGVASVLEVDTNHFKGNYPDRCSVEWIDAPGARIPDLVTSGQWSLLLPESKLGAHSRHFFPPLRPLATDRSPATHVRVNIFPDGGLSRVRVWGARS
ncbi:MAG TPA: allantoicase [Polyangiaceae bacterium]|nr:allantoicase [Polyangiaceae bacterium]